MIGARMSSQATEVSMEDWERRKQFVRFTDQDVQLLRELRPIAEAYADEVVDDLYRQFLAFPESSGFFRDETTLQRVKAAQKEYFLGLTGGDYGERYLANRLHIGRVHQQIGLSPRWYMGAYSLYIQACVPRVLSAFPADPDKGRQGLLALLKIITLDKELAITTYSVAREEVIGRQAREIVEISTPVIQVWDGILAAPIIGTLDSERTQGLMERLLDRIVETSSSIALVDVTGVPTIDTQTAQHLIETISAVRLLGAQVILTGVRPAIAQTLVHLGIDLSSVTTRPSLAAGLRVALETLSLQITRKDPTR